MVAAGQEAAKHKPLRSLTAYDLYLLATAARDRGSREGLEQAIALFQRSLAVDPDLARAWTGLAAAYGDLAEMDRLSGRPPGGPRRRGTQGDRARYRRAGRPRGLATAYMDAGDAGRAESEFDKAWP